MSLGRRILLRIQDIRNAFDAVYTWYVDGQQVQLGERTDYVFSGSAEGVYTVRVEMRNSYLTATKELKVNVCPSEGTYYRSASAGGLPSCQ